MADAHLTYCESLGEWSTPYTCGERLPCADVARKVDLDRAEHYEREAGR